MPAQEPQPDVTCTYDPATKEVHLHSAVEYTVQSLDVIVRETEIGTNMGQVDGPFRRCGEATTTNTDLVRVSGYADGLRVDTSQGPLAPGVTEETANSSEIEIAADDLVSGALELYARTPEPHQITIERGSVDPNGDGDVDYFVQRLGIVLVWTGSGDDRVDASELPAGGIFRATPFIAFTAGGDDVVIGSAGGDSLNSRAGNDVLRGLDGDDYISGGEGDDRIDGGEGPDPRLDGEKGDDRIRGGEGRDGMVGGDGVDRYVGGPGAESRVQGCERP